MKEIDKKMATIKEFLRDKNERKGIINDAFMKDEISKDQYIQEMNFIFVYFLLSMISNCLISNITLTSIELWTPIYQAHHTEASALYSAAPVHGPETSLADDWPALEKQLTIEEARAGTKGIC